MIESIVDLPNDWTNEQIRAWYATSDQKIMAIQPVETIEEWRERRANAIKALQDYTAENFFASEMDAGNGVVEMSVNVDIVSV